jgi:L-lactate dehydrogenase
VKISIVGVGRVGPTLAHTIVMGGLADSLVLVSRDRNRATGHALDLQHAASLVDKPVIVKSGDVSATDDSQVIAVCASARLADDQTDRMLLADKNAVIYRSLIPQLAAISPNAVFLVISNPVDVMTWATLRLSGLSVSQVCGVGTLVDSARFRCRASSELGVHTDDIRAYVIGEHGSSQVAAMHAASIGGEQLDRSRQRIRELAIETVESGTEVLRAKGYTDFAVATAAAKVIRSIQLDDRRTMPLSVMLDGFCGVDDVCMSVPVVVGRHGVTQVLRPLLSEDEIAAFRESAARIRSVNAAIERFLDT